MATIFDIANRLADLTTSEKLTWEMDGNENSFATKLEDLTVTISKNPHTPHPTLAVKNRQGHTVETYTAHDFVGTIGGTISDIFRRAKDQTLSGKQTMSDLLTKLEDKAQEPDQA